MPPSPRWICSRIFLPALLLVPWACLPAPLPVGESPKLAADASRFRIDSPQGIGSGDPDTDSRAKSLAGGVAGSPAQVQGPFDARSRDAISGMAPASQPGRRGPRGACERSASDICYDLADGRIVYRPARQYMPKFDGLTAESVSLRRDAIRLRYSFK